MLCGEKFQCCDRNGSALGTLIQNSECAKLMVLCVCMCGGAGRGQRWERGTDSSPVVSKVI